MAIERFPVGMALRAATLALTIAVAAACTPSAPAPADGVQETAVTVNDSVCVPNEVTVKAGKNRFVITNQSMRPLEWEILDGVMVVDERENIVPGLVQTLTANLKPGKYVMTCGLLTNPRGTLTVTENAGAPKAKPTPLEFVSAQAEYKVFVHDRVAAMQGQVAALSDALRSHDLGRARQLYVPSRQAWQQLNGAAVLSSALYDRLEGSASLYGGGATDPAFVGWHRIESLLFDPKTDASAGQWTALADALVADSKSIGESLTSTRTDVPTIFKGAALSAQRIADHKLKGLDNPWAGTDLVDASNNLIGLRKIVSLFGNALSEHAPEQLASMRQALDALEQGLAQVNAGKQILRDQQRQALSAQAATLAKDFNLTLEKLEL